MKWFCTRPLVDRPQMKNVLARIQKVLFPAASDNAARLSCSALPPEKRDGAGTTVAAGVVAHDNEHQDKAGQAERRRRHHRVAPAEVFGEVRRSRQKEQLSRRIAGAQNADDESAPLGEPARRDGGAEHVRGRARRKADHYAPGQPKLPDRSDLRRQGQSGDDKRQCRGDDLSYSVAEHDGCGERTHHPVQKDAQRERSGDRSEVPAEFGLQRKHQDADHSHGGGRRQHSQEYDGDDGPSVMDAHPLKCPRQKS